VLTGLGFVTAAGLGAALRLAATERWPGGHLGTMSVNVVGSFALGLLAGANPTTFTIIGMGGLGTFTTFSTFIADAVGLADTRVGSRRGRSVSHVINTLVLGVGAAALGLTIS
jgi:CrcB protein